MPHSKENLDTLDRAIDYYDQHVESLDKGGSIFILERGSAVATRDLLRQFRDTPPGINWHKFEEKSPELKEIESGLKESDIVLVRVQDGYLGKYRMATGYLHMPFPYTIGGDHQPGWWLDDGDTWVSLNQVSHWAEITDPSLPT